MAQIELVFCELHAPLFLSGKNFGMKLDEKKHPGLKLHYDRGEKELLVSYKRPNCAAEAVAIVPLSNVASMTPVPVVTEVAATPVKEAAPAPAPITINPLPVRVQVPGMSQAQVASPHQHVFEGIGKGKTK